MKQFTLGNYLVAASYLLWKGARVDHLDDLLALLSSQYVSLAQLILNLPQPFEDRLRFSQVLFVKQIIDGLYHEL